MSRAQKSASPRTDAGHSAPPPASSAQPRRKRPWLLALAVALFTGWLIFLASMAVGG